MKRRSVAVIGAGAAGMMAAVTAAREGASVTVYEHRSEAGRKLLMTGNGKCNLTNRRMDARYYYSGCAEGEHIIQSVLAEFDETQTLAFFHEIGLLTYERDGYVYPQSEQAVTVRDVLFRECLLSGVLFHFDTDIYSLLNYEKKTGTFAIGNQKYDRLILACGGKSERQTGSDGSGYELAKRFGHRIGTPLPGLVPLYTGESGWELLTGVRAKARICLFVEGTMVKESCGELQFTAQGISGIPVFELSRIAVHSIYEGKRVEAEICFLNGRDQEAVQSLADRMLVRESVMTGGQLQNAGLSPKQKLTGLVNDKILDFILQKTGEEGLAEQVTRLLFSCRIAITGYGKLDHAQVTSGGILLDEVSAQLESRLCRGLFFAGEMLDVDGICGGYNLQWAWSSGYAAGRAAAGEYFSSPLREKSFRNGD